MAWGVSTTPSDKPKMVPVEQGSLRMGGFFETPVKGATIAGASASEVVPGFSGNTVERRQETAFVW